MRKKKKTNSTKDKKSKYEYPEFLLRIKFINYETLKKWHLIDNRTYRKHIEKQIHNNYEGGNNDEQ